MADSSINPCRKLRRIQVGIEGGIFKQARIDHCLREIYIQAVEEKV